MDFTYSAKGRNWLHSKYDMYCANIVAIVGSTFTAETSATGARVVPHDTKNVKQPSAEQQDVPSSHAACLHRL